MQLRIASDLHLEFYDYKSHPNSFRDINDFILLPSMGADVEENQTLILAGDILTALNCERYELFFDSVSKRFKHILMVPGNHEHYKFNFLETAEHLKEFYSKWDNIYFLNNEIKELDGVAFFGDTLWTSFNNDSLAMNYARYGMPDFNIVSYGKDMKFTPEQSIFEHNLGLLGLSKFAKMKHDKKVVITHHAPSFKSTALKFAGSPLNPAFASNIEDMIKAVNAKVWVHGHMHNNADYTIHNTRIINNPYGYENENPDYIPRLVVDI